MCPTGWLYLILQCIHPLSCPKTLGVFSGFRYAIQCYHNISVCISWYICERISFTYIFRSKMLEMWQVNSEIMPELFSKVVVPITSRVWDILWSPSAPALDINTFEVFRLNGCEIASHGGPEVALPSTSKVMLNIFHACVFLGHMCFHVCIYKIPIHILCPFF